MSVTEDCSLYLTTEDGHQVFVRQWDTQQPVRGWIHILHGMVEHCGRYGELARSLNQLGFQVVSHDHRGHGNSVKQEADRGHYADTHGWQKVSEDVSCVQRYIAQQASQAKRLILGHSMGSYIAQQYAILQGHTLDGLILSGSTSQPALLLGLLKCVIGLESFRQGPRGKSALINMLVFGAFNQKFKPARTSFDWLSRDPAQVDAYVNDPLCGYLCTNQTWSDMIGGLQHISKPENLKQIPTNLPVYILGGDMDPVSDQGKGLHRLNTLYQDTGLSDLTFKLYEEARHELFNETNKKQVMDELAIWLNRRIT